MKLRYLTTYNEHGFSSERMLQFWNEEFEYWEDVENIRINKNDPRVYNPPYEKEPTEEEIAEQEFLEKEEQHEINEFYRKAYYKKKGWTFIARPFQG